MVATDPIKGPDMSRRVELAGKTVYSHGRNIYYDEKGYAVMSWDPSKPQFRGTTRSVIQQPIEDALAGKPWNPDYSDLTPFPWEDDFKEEPEEEG